MPDAMAAGIADVIVALGYLSDEWAQQVIAEARTAGARPRR
jgi:hypothetical protein